MKIIAKVQLENDNWSKNGHLTHSKTTLNDFYKSLEIEYPKFYKMDILSKKGFLLCEYLLKDLAFDPKRTSIFLWNENSSLASDRKHSENILAEIDNPANFVYTLPNISIGEIAIRHKITGETGFFVQANFSEESMQQILQVYALEDIDFIIAGCILEHSASLYLLTK